MRAAILLLAALAVACTDTDKSPKEPDPVTAPLTAEPTGPTPEADLRRLRPNGRLGYTVIPRPQPDPEMLAFPLTLDEPHHRGRACRAPSFPPTRAMLDHTESAPAEVDSWWFEFSPEGLAHKRIEPAKLEPLVDIARTQMLGDYRIGYVIFRWQGELRYHGWRTKVQYDGPVAYSTIFGDLRARLGCEKVDLQWIAPPPIPYRGYAVFGVEHPDEVIRGLPPLNPGHIGRLCRRPDFEPTRHPAYDVPEGVDAWFFEYDPSTYAGFGHKFAPLDGRTDYRAGYVVYDWGGQLRYHDWHSRRGTTGGGPMMLGALRADIAWRFGCLDHWHN